MARQTRQQRRDRRAQAADGAPRPAAQRQVTRAVAQATPEPAHGTPRGVPGSGGRRFVAESWAELKKVEWPRQQQVIAGTAVVLVACILVGVYLWGLDQVFKRLVEHVLLK